MHCLESRGAQMLEETQTERLKAFSRLKFIEWFFSDTYNHINIRVA
jgi:hypothetical protein